MSKSKKILIWLFSALLFLALSAALFSGCAEKKEEAPTEMTPTAEDVGVSKPYITTIAPVKDGFMVIYSDGSSSTISYKEKEPEVKEKFVVSLTHSDGSIAVNYSDGTVEYLHISSEAAPDNQGSSEGTESGFKYVTRITDDGDGYLTVRYSDDTIEKVVKIDLAELEKEEVYIKDVAQTEDGITVTYSDGTSGLIPSTDESDVTLDDLYDSYCEYYEADVTLQEFLRAFLTVSATTAEVSEIVTPTLLRSAVEINTEFGVPSTPYKATYSGSGVIWQIYEDFTYIVTNYHVVYNENADLATNNNSYIARKILIFLYGSSTATECEYVNGSATVDIAVIKVATDTIKAVNTNIKAATFGGEYHVGDTVLAVGNPRGEGISVTRGIVCVESQYVNMSIGGVGREYRVMRIDAPIYGGSSGGGLYNVRGELIGITNGGGGDKGQNINYAIPLQIAKAAADSIINNSRDSDPNTNGLYKFSIGELKAVNTHYVYDEETGYGKIVEDVIVDNDGSPEKLVKIVINGEEYKIDRLYDAYEALYNVNVGADVEWTLLSGALYNVKEHVDVALGDLTNID